MEQLLQTLEGLEQGKASPSTKNVTVYNKSLTVYEKVNLLMVYACVKRSSY